MHVGAAFIFQNLARARSDAAVYQDELRLADLVEPLGFESIWAAEHHFTDYTLCPDPIQFLTYMAGRTTSARLGTMIIVLPWHDPVRVAEQISMLDSMSDGRLIVGIGRGLGRVEFDGFRVPMEESRERFLESAEIILNGLEYGCVEYDGEIYQQPKRDIRPVPAGSFRGRIYAAAVSPESFQTMAELGVGILIIPQKPWQTVADELGSYRSVFRAVNGAEAPPVSSAGWVFCDPDEDRAREMAHHYIGRYYESVMQHYELAGRHFAQTKGYEYYDRMSENINKYGRDEAVEFFVDLHVWGTPEQCYDRVRKIGETVGCDRFMGVFSYAGMPYEEAERNMRLFAKEVAPELKALGTCASSAEGENGGASE